MMLHPFQNSLLASKAFCLMLFGWCSVLPGACILQDNQIQSYLDQHGLTELSEAYLRGQLDRAQSKQEKISIANRLAHFYIEQSAAGEHGSELGKQLKDLLARFPELDDPQFNVALLQIEYRECKALFQNWIESKRDEKIRDELNEKWNSFDIELNRLKNSVDADNYRVVSQLEYFAGWSRYYLAISISDGGQRAEILKNSARSFRELLDLTDSQSIEDVDHEWLNLESIWNIRCLIGLGMVEQARKNEVAASACFDRILNDDSQQSMRDETRQWQFHSYYFAGLMRQAVKLSEQLFVENRASTDFWSSLVVAGRVWIDPESIEAKRLTMIGLTGLAKSNRFDLVLKHLETHDIQLTPDSFYASWIAAKVSTNQFEQTRDKEKLKLAYKLIQSALDFSGAIKDESSVANAKWLNAWIEYKLGDLEKAAESFQTVAQFVRYSRPDLSSQALWTRIQILRQLSSAEKRFQIQLAAAQSQLKRWFPESRYVQIAEFEQKRNQIISLSPSEVIQRLQSIDEQDPNFETAQLDIANASYQLWEEAHNSKTANSELAFSDLSDRVNFYFDRLPNASAEKKLQCGLLLVEAFLKRRPINIELTESWIQLLKNIAQKVDDDHPAKSELLIKEMKWAEHQNRNDESLEIAQWLADNGATTSQKNMGLIRLANHAESELEIATAENKKSIRRKLVGHYTKLVDHMDADQVQLKNSSNLRLALLRLGDLQMKEGNFKAADAHFGRLIAAFPNDGMILLGRARCSMAIGKPQDAMDDWRVLAKGSPTGSELWLEAKYYIIQTTRETDRRKAKQVYAQTTQLAPNMPEEWKQRYNELEILLTE